MKEIKQKSWLGRNWKWLLPVGGCLTIIILGVLAIGGIFFGVSKLITSSTPYNHAVERAFENQEVIRTLGEPLEAELLINGSINYENDDGQANFKIPISGPNGKARIVVIGTKTYGVWSYEKLFVQIKESRKEINLIDKEQEGI